MLEAAGVRWPESFSVVSAFGPVKKITGNRLLSGIKFQTEGFTSFQVAPQVPRFQSPPPMPTFCNWPCLRDELWDILHVQIVVLDTNI